MVKKWTEDEIEILTNNVTRTFKFGEYKEAVDMIGLNVVVYVKYDDNYVNDLEDNNELVDVMEVKEENNYDSVLFNIELESVNSFCYQYDSPNDKGALNNSYAYIDIYNKYEKKIVLCFLNNGLGT